MILSVEDLVVQSALAGDQLLGGSLRLDTGGVAGIVGHRDAGAAALLDALSGRVTPQSGNIYWHGSIDVKLPWSMRARGEMSEAGPLRLQHFRSDEILRLGVVRVTAPCDLFVDLSVRENLLLGASQRTLRPAIQSDLADLLDMLPELKTQRSINQLNALGRKLVALGRAMMSQPRVLLLQEPLRGLDQSAAARMSQILGTIHSQGVALLICAPELDLIPVYPERIYRLRGGHLVRTRHQVRTPTDTPVSVFG